MGAFFSATSMIGFMAGAGIVVRNSIILVDFTELRIEEGMPLDEAVIDAGAVDSAHAPDRDGSGGGCCSHPFRPNLSGTCHLAHGGRNRIS